jgi:hypothetical protein
MKSHSKLRVVTNSQLKAESNEPTVESQVKAWSLARQDRETHINMPSTTCQNFTSAAIKEIDQ